MKTEEYMMIVVGAMLFIIYAILTNTQLEHIERRIEVLEAFCD